MGKRRKPKQFTTLTGARLYAIRMVYGAGQTQTEFAERFGATQNQWSQWESGRSPPDLETMIRLGDKLDVGLDWIYRGKESDLPGARAAEILAAMPPLSETG